MVNSEFGASFGSQRLSVPRIVGLAKEEENMNIEYHGDSDR